MTSMHCSQNIKWLACLMNIVSSYRPYRYYAVAILLIITFYHFIFRYIRPQFFYNNPLLSFIQLVIGPYTDDLGNVLPYAVEGVGVPVDPLAFAGLLGAYFAVSVSVFSIFNKNDTICKSKCFVT